MTASRRSPLARATLVVVLLVLAAGGAGLGYLFLRGAPPPPVAVGSPSPGTSVAPGATSAASPLEPGELAGTWTIDPAIGSFSDFSSSFVGYRVQETLVNIGAQEAVGRTPDVSGTLAFDGSSITAVDVTVDLATLQSDDDRRDGQLARQGIETDRFPTAAFRLTSAIDLGAVPADGQVVQATATGELTLHGVTRAVEVPVQAVLSGDVVTVSGSIEIAFDDFEIEQPSSFLVLSIEDHGVMEFQLHFRRG